MKILMIGLGSIGQRHLRNIRRIYGNEPEILAYRVRRLQQTFSDEMKIRDGVNLEEEFGITVYQDLDEALAQKPDIAFITNITAKHMECALKVAKAGCDIFLEKPISDTLDGVDELQRIVKEKGLVVYVGYQNRYHACIQKVKSLLEQNVIGRLISVDNEFSERLATMHTYEDYSTTYMARSEMGGGPVLNLQIHALDYLQWLFGVPKAAYAVAGTNSQLKIDVEDFASTIYRVELENGTTIPVYSHTDFLQFPPVHVVKVVGEKGRIEANLNEATVKLYVEGELVEEKSYPDFVRNDMFIRELKDFIDCVQTRREPEMSLAQGVVGLKMALAAKRSAKEHREVVLEEL